MPPTVVSISYTRDNALHRRLGSLLLVRSDSMTKDIEVIPQAHGQHRADHCYDNVHPEVARKCRLGVAVTPIEE